MNKTDQLNQTDQLNPAGQATETVTILLLSASPSSHRYFQAFCDLRGWRLFHSWTLEHAKELLQSKEVPVVVLDETWETEEFRQALSGLDRLPPRIFPLSQPYNDNRVFGNVTLAWLSWQVRAKLGWEIGYSIPGDAAC